MTNGIDCPNRAVGCQGKCEKYLAFRAELDRINMVKRKESFGADVAYQAMFAQKRKLMKTPNGRHALAQR